jgi:photosystem II stability/assembly factor-like uncharacterized protein
MNRLTLLFISLICSNLLHSQVNFQNISTSTNYNNEVVWADINTIYSVGSYFDFAGSLSSTGYIYKSTNNGNSFSIVKQKADANYKGVWFLNKDIGFVCGSEDNKSVVLKTGDGGATWKSQVLLGSNLSQAIYFINNTIGFVACGSVIYKTIDGGETWKSNNQGSDVVKMQFVTEQKGYALTGVGLLLVTDNQGASWQKLQIDARYSPNDSPLWCYAMHWLSEKIGLIGTAHGVFYKTYDGGNTWKIIPLRNTSDDQIEDIKFITPSLGYAVGFGADNFIYKTKDSGDTWERYYNGRTGLNVFSNLAIGKDGLNASAIITGFGNFLKTTNINPELDGTRPYASLQGFGATCGDETIDLKLDIMGDNPPFTVVYTYNSTDFTINNITSTPYFIKVKPQNISLNTYELKNIKNNAGTSGYVAGKAEIYKNLPSKAVLKDIKQTLCSKDSVLLSIELSGCSPWKLEYTDGTTTFTQANITNTNFNLKVSPQKTATFSLKSVTDASGTISTNVSGKAELTIDSVSVKLTYYDSVKEICPGSTQDISLFLSGNPPFTLYYSNGKENFKIENIKNAGYFYLSVQIDTSPITVTRITNACGEGVVENGTIARFKLRPYKPFPTDVKFQLVDNKRDKVLITFKNTDTAIEANLTSFEILTAPPPYNKINFNTLGRFAGFGEKSFTQNLYQTGMHYYRFSQYTGFCTVFSSKIDSFYLKPFFEKNNFLDYSEYFSTYIDFNNDGNQDFMADGVYQGDGKFNFNKLADRQKAENAFGATLVADYDNDGFEDVLKYTRDEMSLHRNYKNGEFRMVKKWSPYNYGANSIFLDLDNDGDVDIYSGGSNAFRNDGNDIFTPLSISVPEEWNYYEPTIIDVNNDLKPDILYPSGDSLIMFFNKGNFTFTRIAQYLPNFGFYTNKITLLYYTNQKNNTFQKLNTPIEGASTFLYGDFDNNGFLDGNNTFQGGVFGYNLYQSETSFETVANFLNEASNANQVADLNNDGYIDAIGKSTLSGFHALKNTKFSPKNGITIKCVGTKSNRSAIGALVCVKAKVDGQNFVRYQKIRSGSLHFGIGNATIIDSIIVRFPSGIIVRKANIAPNQRYIVTEEPLPIPIAPNALSAISYNTKRIDLKWTLNTKNYAGVIVERSLNPTTGFVSLDTIFDYSNSAKDSSVVSGTYYYYRVRAFSLGVVSDYSNIVGVRVFTNCSLGIQLLNPSVTEVKFGDNVELKATTGDNISYRWYNYTINEVVSGEGDTTATFKAVILGKYAAIAIKNNECVDTTKSVEVRLSYLFTQDLANTLALKPKSSASPEYLCSSWADYDKDGDDDVLVVEGLFSTKLFRNDGNLKFTDVTLTAFGSDTIKAPLFASWGDYDNDGFADIFLTGGYKFSGSEKNILYKNKGDGTFQKITNTILTEDNNNHRNGTWFDANNDGLLDVLSCSSEGSTVYLNKNNGVFEKSSTLDRSLQPSVGIIDYDNDGLDDILMVTRDTSDSYSERLILYLNSGQGKFIKKVLPLLSDVFYNRYTINIPSNTYNYNFNIIDINNDGLLDIFISKPAPEQTALINKGGGVFEQKIIEGFVLKPEDFAKPMTWGDFDNNGWLDCYTNGTFYMNYGNGKFLTQIDAPLFPLFYYGKSGATSVDMNNDGFLEILQSIVSDYRQDFNDAYGARLFLNKGNGNNWLTIKPLATVSNRLALGTIFKIKATVNGKKMWMTRTIQGQTGYLGQSPQKANFGLGDATLIDSVIVKFPSGITRKFVNITANQIMEVSEDERIIPDFPLVVTGKDTCNNKITIDLTVSGGKTPYKYLWNTGAATPSVSSLSTGVFTVTVTDAANKTSVKSFTIRSCVWPGDTDSSGTVNHFDLLNIGLNYNTAGLARTANMQNTDWYGHFAEYWSKNSENSSINLKHMDTNGDGTISFTDTLAINKNWEKTHNLIASKPISTLSLTPPISIETSPVSENKSYDFPIILGDAINTVEAIYGLGFSIGYDANKVVPNSIFITFEKCWLGKDIITISKNFNDIGRLDVALVRKNKLNIEGRGQIATLHFTVKKGATSSSNQMNFTIKNSKAIDNTNRLLPLSEKSSISAVTPTQETGWESDVTIYPNPVQNMIHIESTDIKIKRVEILDYRGLRQMELSEQNSFYKIDMTEFPNSFYIVKVYTDKGVMLRKIIKIN